MAEEQNVIQWVYASKNELELAERYDQWAKTYEDDLDRDIGWYGPIRAVESAVKYVARDARILDAGAGTGLVGARRSLNVRPSVPALLNRNSRCENRVTGEQ